MQVPHGSARTDSQLESTVRSCSSLRRRDRISQMSGVEISYLADHPEYIPELARWLFDHWRPFLGEETIQTRVEKLQAHLNRDKLPIAWVAHANGQLLGTAALREHDLEGHENLSPWL